MNYNAKNILKNNIPLGIHHDALENSVFRLKIGEKDE
jgi:hypothetical protein